MGTRVKQLGRVVDHTPPSSAKVKNGWRYTSTPNVCMAWNSVKHRANFTITFTIYAKLYHAVSYYCIFGLFNNTVLTTYIIYKHKIGRQ